MKRYVIPYYLLFVLLIMGGFASMARNDYGMTLLGLVSFAFAGMFLFELRDKARNASPIRRVELVSLSAVSFMIGLRIFYIHFPGVEFVFAFAGTLLAMTLTVSGIRQTQEVLNSGKAIAIVIATFYGSIVVYVVALGLAPFAPAILDPLGIIATALLFAFLFGNVVIGQKSIQGQKVSALQLVRHQKDRLILLSSLFAVFSMHAALNKVNVLPPLHSGKYPPAYSILVSNTDDKGKKIKDHEMFKAAYEALIRRHAGGND